MADGTKILAKAVRRLQVGVRALGLKIGDRVTVTASSVQYGDRAPHFSVQTEVRMPNDVLVSAGCQHNIAVYCWPEVRVVTDLHLCDVNTGAPMYPEQNGWYWFCGAFAVPYEKHHGGSSPCAHTPEACIQILADHMRISPEIVGQCGREIIMPRAMELAQEVGYWVAGSIHKHKAIHMAASGLFTKWVVQQRPRWKLEAERAGQFLKDHQEV